MHLDGIGQDVSTDKLYKRQTFIIINFYITMANNLVCVFRKSFAFWQIVVF